jgi:penicillin-binding protein 1A
MNKLMELGVWVEDFLRRSTLLALVVLSVIAGGLTGLVMAYQASFTSFAAEVENLADYRPSEITKVYADDGQTVIGELSLERRVPLEYAQIPDQMKKAVLAIEDTRFYDHIGIDPVRLVGAAVKNITLGRRAQGASTLTQQLARELFLKKEKTYIRKIREILYAVQLERYYTKDQIMTLYCNLFFLGGGAYGFEAAANYYFSKPLKDLSLDQYALLAAIPKSPTQYSPVLRPQAAKERRNLVLQSMAEAGFISEAEAEEAKQKPIKLDLDEARNNDRSPYAYFVEEVRKELGRLATEKYPQEQMYIYRAGLSVYTTLDAQAQRQATSAVRKFLRKWDHARGWDGKLENILTAGEDLDSYRHPTWTHGAPEVGEAVTGLVKDVNEKGALVSFGRYSALVTEKETEWTRKKPQAILKRGDLAEFLVEGVDEAKKTLSVKLDQDPEVQGALVLVDAKTGEVKAMVGGYDFGKNKFNHATQANRQTGSAFKPFIYAAALEEGLKPDDLVNDAPFKRGSWEPHNYDNRFMGPMPIRKALALSRNIPAVRVLDEIGVNSATKMVKRLGLPNPMAPFLPSALGATEEPLLSMTSAYTTFPNKGVRIEPVRIRKVVDRDGQVIDEAKPKSYKVLSEYVAAQMVSMMRGVVESGTAAAAGSLGRELAGKTGTVNDYTDAWFIGYTPTYVCGTWIGYSSEKRTLGKSGSGTGAALPFWLDFMREYLKDKPKEKFGPVPPVPDDLKNIQAARAKERAAELAKMFGNKGDVLPATTDGLDIDPLGNAAPPRTGPDTAKVPPPASAEPRPTPKPLPEPAKPESRPRVATPASESKPVTTDDKVKKGKKGKVDEVGSN